MSSEAWLAEYKMVRDVQLPLVRSVFRRLNAGVGDYRYIALSDRYAETWRPGHIRAALLAAASESFSWYVQIPFHVQTPQTACATMEQLRRDFVFETFTPHRFEIAMGPRAAAVMRICLYSIEEFESVQDIPVAHMVRA